MPRPTPSQYIELTLALDREEGRWNRKNKDDHQCIPVGRPRLAQSINTAMPNHAQTVMGAVKYARKQWANFTISWIDMDEAVQAAILSVLEGIAAGITDEGILFDRARKAAYNELYQWLTPRIRYIHPQIRTPEVPILPVARAIYRKLDKRGERGRRSAALKAFVIQRRMSGYSNISIAHETQTMNARHRLTVRNVSQHFNTAYAIIFDCQRGNRR